MDPHLRKRNREQGPRGLIDNTGSYCLQAGPDISGGLAAGDLASLKDGTGTYSEALRSMFQILDLIQLALPRMI